MNLPISSRTSMQRTAAQLFIPKVIAVTAISFMSAHAFAQTGFDFGIKGLVQSSSLINVKDQAAGNELNFTDRMGVGGGVSAGYTFTSHIGAEINILYSPQGTQYNGDANDIPAADNGVMGNEIQRVALYNGIPLSGNYTANYYLDYIKIPILLRLNGRDTKRVYFSSFLGPQFDILSSATITINGHGVSAVENNLKPADVYKKSGTDAVLGLGLGVNLTKNFVLLAHLRLDYGLGNAENKSASYTSGGTTYDFYNPKRGVTNNATGGGLISLNYKLVKKEKEKATRRYK